MAEDQTPKTIDRYEIIGSLGKGAMGEVFLAREPELDREVAIKVLLSAEEDLKKRFIEEARATARCTHENIVVIHRVDAFQDRPYMVLEYLKGKTLLQWLEAPEFEESQDRQQFALNTMLSVARALSYAHAKAIIHRDLKPANIMFGENGVPKVLDFGLAKMVQPLTGPLELNGISSLSRRSTGVCGTIPYMAPEQLSMLEVDHRADIWAFGIILHEMATGRHPQGEFNSEVLQQVRQLDTPSPPTQDCDTDVANLIDACLAKRVEARIACADDLVLRIESMLGVPPQSKDRWPAPYRAMSFTSNSGDELLAPEPPPHPLTRIATSRRAILAVVAMVVLWVSGMFPALAPEPALPSVVVGDFKGALADDETMADALVEMLRMGIDASHTVQLLSRADVEATLVRMEKDPRTRIDRATGSEVCVREDIQYLLLPSMEALGDQRFKILVQLFDVRRAKVIEVFESATVHRNDVIDEIGKISDRLGHRLGLPKEGTERNRRPLAKVTTADLRALRLYTAAKQADEKDDLKNAIALFKEAIELDPDFAMARAKLGTVLYFGTESRLEGLQQWRRALSLGGRLPLREKLYIEASLAWHGEPSTMHRKWVVYSTQFSKQLSGHANLGLVNQWYQGDFVNALRSFRRLLELDPNVGRHYHDVGYVLMEAEETKEALESFNKGVKIDGRPRYGGAADAMIVLGWHEEALRYMDRTKSVPNADDIDYDLEFHLKRVLVAADRERPRSAFESAAAALEKARQSGEHKLLARAQMARATLHWMEKDSASALRFLKDAMSSLMTDLQREDLALMAQPVAHLALIGKLMLRCGAREEAKIIYTKLQHFTEPYKIAKWRAYVGLLEGELMLADGRSKESISVFRKALRYMEIFSLRSSLAEALSVEAKGRVTPEQTAAWQWVAKHRGRAMSEHVDRFFGRELRMAETRIAQRHLELQ